MATAGVGAAVAAPAGPASAGRVNAAADPTATAPSAALRILDTGEHLSYETGPWHGLVPGAKPIHVNATLPPRGALGVLGPTVAGIERKAAVPTTKRVSAPRPGSPARGVVWRAMARRSPRRSHLSGPGEPPVATSHQRDSPGGGTSVVEEAAGWTVVGQGGEVHHDACPFFDQVARLGRPCLPACRRTRLPSRGQVLLGPVSLGLDRATLVAPVAGVAWAAMVEEDRIGQLRAPRHRVRSHDVGVADIGRRRVPGL